MATMKNPQDITSQARAQAGAPLPTFQRNPGLQSRPSRTPPQTGFNTSINVPLPQTTPTHRSGIPATNLQSGPVDFGGQHASLGRYRPPMFDLQGNPDPRDIGGYAYNLPNAYGPFPLAQHRGRFLAQDIAPAGPNLPSRPTSLIDALRDGLIRMIQAGPMQGVTQGPPQTAPTTPGQGDQGASASGSGGATPPMDAGGGGFGGGGGGGGSGMPGVPGINDLLFRWDPRPRFDAWTPPSTTNKYGYLPAFEAEMASRNQMLSNRRPAASWEEMFGSIGPPSQEMLNALGANAQMAQGLRDGDFYVPMPAFRSPAAQQQPMPKWSRRGI